ncbi:MAG: hypothetical protein ACE5HO_20775 [bacterium]
MNVSFRLRQPPDAGISWIGADALETVAVPKVLFVIPSDEVVGESGYATDVWLSILLSITF